MVNKLRPADRSAEDEGRKCMEQVRVRWRHRIARTRIPARPGPREERAARGRERAGRPQEPAARDLE